MKSVPGDITRPITDRVKESLFNILGPDIQGATMLDLFAGTGAVGIEALSRGADWVQLNDRHRLAIRTIRANLETTRLGARSLVTQLDAFTLLDQEPDRGFDYVYIAPPQYKGLWVQAIQSLDRNVGWLSHDAWVIVQIDPVEDAEVDLENLEEFDRRKYGSTVLVFYAIRGADV